MFCNQDSDYTDLNDKPPSNELQCGGPTTTSRFAEQYSVAENRENFLYGYDQICQNSYQKEQEIRSHGPKSVETDYTISPHPYTAEEYFPHFDKDDDMNSNEDSDTPSNSGSEWSFSLPEPCRKSVCNKKSVSKFTPLTKARSYKKKSESEKRNKKYQEGREKNNDSVRKCRLKAKEEQMKKDKDFEDMKTRNSELERLLENEKQGRRRDGETIKRLIADMDELKMRLNLSSQLSYH